MNTPDARVRFSGKLVMVGFGAIAQGVLPLLFRHLTLSPEQVTIITADTEGLDEARAYGVRHRLLPLTAENYRAVLAPVLSAGDFLLNLSIHVSSVALIELAQERGALYLDACIEPWAGGYTDPSLSASQRSNYGLREAAKALARPHTPTAVLTHGANPGWVSHLVKQALLDIAAATDFSVAKPTCREEWARLAQALGVKVIHIAERDWQVGARRKRPNEFVNTWSVEGFVGEGCQPAELGWGSHERHFPDDGRRHGYGCEAAIYLDRPGAATRVRSWTPLAGPYHGFLITHGEAISIADYLTVGAGQKPEYRPTVHYAYHPCDDAVLSLHELAGREWRLQDHRRILVEEIEPDGVDELGILVMGHKKTSYWLGSRLSSREAKTLAPFSSATVLQVAAGVMAGVCWAIENPRRGVVDPDEMDFEPVLARCRPYLGEIVGVFSDWTPLDGRADFFPQRIDAADPWQFLNFRVF
ncbi:MAG: saccharopine dehydrogenase NADP-binding domain-containing protein [Rhodocyclaceae bacterium]|nr:saccharopine dehydrogenase NADP-binding domain-containing protein [Rhodocyclaceae bacterium]